MAGFFGQGMEFDFSLCTIPLAQPSNTPEKDVKRELYEKNYSERC
jgi:hypothetical protein